MSRKYEVKKGKRYRAKIKLTFMESFAGNQLIKDKLEEVGFVDVKVVGSGHTRWAVGTWDFESIAAEVPNQIVEVEQIEAS